jgi:hypothetical protein
VVNLRGVAGNASFIMAHNEFSDLTKDEFMR